MKKAAKSKEGKEDEAEEDSEKKVMPRRCSTNFNLGSEQEELEEGSRGSWSGSSSLSKLRLGLLHVQHWNAQRVLPKGSLPNKREEGEGRAVRGEWQGQTQERRRANELKEFLEGHKTSTETRLDADQTAQIVREQESSRRGKGRRGRKRRSCCLWNWNWNWSRVAVILRCFLASFRPKCA